MGSWAAERRLGVLPAWQKVLRACMNRNARLGVWCVAVATLCLGVRAMLLNPGPRSHSSSLNIALVDAVGHSNERAVAGLLSQGASPNAKNDYGWPVLLLATENQQPAIVELLLDRGADINATNQHGDTALMRASGTVPVLRPLLDHGADINVRNAVGQTALIYAAMSNAGADGVALLLAHNAPVDTTDSEGRSALWYAHYNGWRDNERLIRAKLKA